MTKWMVFFANDAMKQSSLSHEINISSCSGQMSLTLYKCPLRYERHHMYTLTRSCTWIFSYMQKSTNSAPKLINAYHSVVRESAYWQICQNAWMSELKICDMLCTRNGPVNYRTANCVSLELGPSSCIQNITVLNDTVSPRYAKYVADLSHA